jgi:hypothetical protein
VTGDTRRVDRGRGHSYLLDGEKVPGVTTLIGDGLPKPALTRWAANTAAAYAVDRWAELADVPISERLKRISGAPWADRDSAAVRGTRIHTLAEPLSRGERVDVPSELAGHVESCVRFLDEWDVRPVLIERPVFHRRWHYGGTVDLVADLADGQRWILDYKTSRSGVFGDTAVQLSAYRYAEFYLDDDGAEQPMPEVDAAGVVWLRADGYDLYPYDAGPSTFRSFLYVAQTAALAQRLNDLRGEAITPPRKASVA